MAIKNFDPALAPKHWDKAASPLVDQHHLDVLGRFERLAAKRSPAFREEALNFLMEWRNHHRQGYEALPPAELVLAAILGTSIRRGMRGEHDDLI